MISAVKPSRYKDIEILLFDLGGVLVEFRGIPKMQAWMNNRADMDEIYRMWLFSPSVRKFESGKMKSDEFAEAIIKEFGFNVNSEQFILEYPDFISGFYNGVKELLEELGRKYKVACLSNTNEIHWDKMCRDDCIESIIPVTFPSYKTGYMKPEKEAYIHAIRELNCEPGRILFFDDNRINVDAALESGMKAICVRGFDVLKLRLEEIGII
ncbi:MAG: HAD-IA family hydrolase [Clostridiaceae bacterium]